VIIGTLEAVTNLKAQNLNLVKRYGVTCTYQISTAETPAMSVLERGIPSLVFATTAWTERSECW
jgi:hypothetical protein